MNVTLQEPTPFDQSAVWRIHDAYFASRGIEAWNAGEVPFYATSSFVTATQHARFFTDFVRQRIAAGQLGPDDEVWVLEVGSGLGRFATNFFRALLKSCGPDGKALLHRVRYVLSDYSPKSLGEAIAVPVLARLVQEGSVVPALYDLRNPSELRNLAGEPLAVPRLTWIVANYVSCVLPVKTFQWRRAEGIFEQNVALSTVVPDDSVRTEPEEVLQDLLSDPTRARLLEESVTMDVVWKPIDLDEVYPSGPHAQVLRTFTADQPEITFSYPHGFFDFLQVAGKLLARGGLVLVNDYGSVDIASIRGRYDRKPQIYGNSIAVAIHFPVVQAWARVAGWSSVRTDDVLASIHSCALRPSGPFDEGERSAFDAAYVRSRATDDMIDAASAAAMCVDNKEFDRAVRFYRRCLALEPDSVEFHHKLGNAAIEGRRYELAAKYLKRGVELAGPDNTTYDLEFQLGRAYCLLEDYDTAIGWYEKAVAKENHATTYTNLGVVYQQQGRLDDAARCYHRALMIDHTEVRARAALLMLRDKWWRDQLRVVVGPDAVDPLAEDDPGR
jgi:tetratricopeptide (TPR) repeat protein